VSLEPADRERIMAAVVEARDAGVPEATIEAEVTRHLEVGEDVFAVTAIVGRLAHYARERRPSRPPADNPVLPRAAPPDEC
jgi:hypothetical protein